MKRLIYIFAIFLPMVHQAQSPFMPEFNFTDIGSPALQGHTEFNAVDQSYKMSGAGYNIWFDRDEFHYASTEISGDFIATANFSFDNTGGDPHKKAGWMMRESLSPDAVHASATMHGDGLTALQWRPEAAVSMRDPEDQVLAPAKDYAILQLERAGNMVYMRAGKPGEPLELVGTKDMGNLPAVVNLGLFVCSHDEDRIETVRIWNVRIDKTVPDDYDPYASGWLKSRMEVIDPFTMKRKVVHVHDSRFEAPNWMPTGQGLLFNQDGLLYTLDLANGVTRQFTTGFANLNNNDHGISFDGKLLAISHHRENMPEGGSTIYTVPIAGGTPTLVTRETPSYWHGWDPDNEHVVFVGKRTTENYHIFRANIHTGKEEQLTSYADAHVDGPEYSPDGKYIYYNGSLTGTMQLWRMKPDGSDQEQLTFDEYNDWFPHISPDGKWIAFLSFSKDINPNDHPSFKRVALRLMPAAGGHIKTIAYLFGGQGTINVPSWSPDSRQLAFVSYTR